jgi:hypothetical protein
VRTDLSGLTGPVVDQVEAVGGQGAQVGGYLVAGPKVTKVLAHACLVGDDERILLGRPALAATGGRHLVVRAFPREADLSRQTRPAEALGEYLRLVERLKEPTGDRAYERLARLLLSARDCYHALGTEDAFTVYLTGLRTELKRRRKLMSILDRYGM